MLGGRGIELDEYTQTFASTRLEIGMKVAFGVGQNTLDVLATVVHSEESEVVIWRGRKNQGHEFRPLSRSGKVGGVRIPKNLDDKSAISKLKSKVEDLIVKTLSERPLGKRGEIFQQNLNRPGYKREF